MSNYWLLLTPIVLLVFLAHTEIPIGQSVGSMQNFYYVSEGPSKQILIETPGAIAVRGYVPRSKVIRQQILDYFPTEVDPEVTPIDRVNVYVVRRAVLEDMKEGNYEGARLACDNIMGFFERDAEAVTALLELSCLTEREIPGTGVYSDIVVVNPSKFGYYQFKDIGYIPCNEYLKDVSRRALFDLLEADRLLAEGIVGIAKCNEDNAKYSLMLAASSRAKGDVLTELDNYLAAVRKSAGCFCG